MAGTVGNRTHPSGFGDRLASLEHSPLYGDPYQIWTGVLLRDRQAWYSSSPMGHIIPAFTAYPQDRYTWIPQMSSKCLMTDTQYETLISLLLSRYWEQQMVMIVSGAVHDSNSFNKWLIGLFTIQGTISFLSFLFALLTTIWWARVVPTHLLPKETDLQSAAVADLLLTHI